MSVLVQLAYPSQGLRVYAASAAFTPVATPTDIVKITGAAGRLVRVLSVNLATTNTAAGSQRYLVIKRSADDTTGTFVAAPAVPFDSGDAAATATVGHYTANPGGLGTVIGTINTVTVASPVLLPASFAGIVQNAGFEMLPIILNGQAYIQPVTLRTAAEVLAINFGGAALVSGQVHAYSVIWTEE